MNSASLYTLLILTGGSAFAETSLPVRHAALQLVREQANEEKTTSVETEEAPSSETDGAVKLPDFTVAEGFRERELMEIVNSQLRFNRSKELTWEQSGYYYSQPWNANELQLGVWATYDNGKDIGNRGSFRVAHVKLVSVAW